MPESHPGYIPPTKKDPNLPLKILRVLPPERFDGGGPNATQNAYTLYFELSREATSYEVIAAKAVLPKFSRVYGDTLELHDTSIESVQANPQEFSNLVRRIELEGKNLQTQSEERERERAAQDAAENAERERLKKIAEQISFD